MRILNLYSGIGGNRKLWGSEHKITAVEINPKIAKIYSNFFPKDKVIVDDAHKFLLKNYKKFDFIWSSPPCPTHSRMRFNHKEKVYPDLTLYQEIIFLQHFFKGKWVVENVVAYYKPLVNPVQLHRHYFWANFFIQKEKFKVLNTCIARNERKFLQDEFGFNLDSFKGIDKRLVLRNCVVPALGKFILDCALKERQTFLFQEKQKINGDDENGSMP